MKDISKTGVRLLISIAMVLTISVGSANAESISDYTAYPPFLPRVTSPNILFLLDYSTSMVRPAYGTCTPISNIAGADDLSTTPDESGCKNSTSSGCLSNCRTNFSNLSYDYDSSTTYSGYFDTSTSGQRYSYNTAQNTWSNDNTSGTWSANFLNWLTMTQFDVLKKVVIGGDIDPAPEQGNPTKLRSILTSGYTFRRQMNLPSSGNSTSCSSSDLPDTLCTQWPTVSYGWLSSASVTTIWSSPDDATVYDDDYSTAQTLPFAFTFYGNTYTSIYISTNGYITFTNPGTTSDSYWTNADMPSIGVPNNIIAPYWDNLVVNGRSGGGSYTSKVYTFTTGTQPNRIFVITYEKVLTYIDYLVVTKDYPLTFQIVLYEGSNHIVFQYNEVRPTRTAQGGGGASATIGVENSGGTGAKRYSYNPGSAVLSNSSAIFATPHISFEVTAATGSGNVTQFKPDGPLSGTYNINIDITNVAGYPNCPSGSYPNKDRGECYDHETVGLLQDFRDGELGGTLGFRLAIMRLKGDATDADGGTVTKHFNQKDTTGWASLIASTRSQTPTSNTPLAEALYEAQGYFREDTSYRFETTDWTYHSTGSTCSTTGTNYDPYCFQSAAQRVPCCKGFVLIVSSGNYSTDNGKNIYGDPDNAEGSNYISQPGGWRSTGETPGEEGTKANGGWLDNVAYQSHTTDLRGDLTGTQNLAIYSVNTFGTGSGDGTDVLKRAAKYGGFEDVDGDSAYDSDKYALVGGQCTSQDGGAYGEDDRNCDGIPDTYFQASGGSDLKAKIIDAVADILKGSASGTTVSVLSTSGTGEGAIYQAYFYPARTEGTTEERTWPGYLRAFFLDKYQNLRDDYSGGTADAKLIMANSDRIARMCLDEAANEVKIKLFADSTGDGETDTTPSTSCPGSDTWTTMDNVVSIWEGGKKLAQRDKGQRSIYTWVDLDGDGVVDNGDFSSLSGEALGFTTANATTLKPYLIINLASRTDTEATNIINFIRGNAVSGYRNRCITISGETAETGCTGSQRVWALGDIIYSTPTLVGWEKYDQIYGDSTYRTFTSQYKNRRGMVYVGTNDGMLHAFNAGVYTAGDNCGGSTTSPVESGCFADNPSSGNGWGSVTIGDELWAFIAHDNLPHLAWLACNGTSTDPSACSDAEYTHVYYVDLKLKVTDARIFTADSTHPGGWGTILIMGMRLGGGAINVDLNGDGDTGDTGEQSFRSAYYVFDITDPEQKPKLLWRFYNSALGFTTSYPAIARICSNATIPCTGTEKWYMIVGSGPRNDTGTDARDYGHKVTTQAGRIFVVDLSDGSLNKTFTVDTNAIMGDPVTVDVDLDFNVDVIYIGSAISTTSGKVYRINTRDGSGNYQLAGSWTRSTLFNPAAPLFAAPSMAKDSLNNLWVFFGTGRLKNTDDLSDSNQQRFYGIKDGCWRSLSDTTCTTLLANNYAYTLSDLLNTTAVQVSSSTGSASQVSGSTDACGGSATCSYAQLLTTVRSSYKGWYVNLTDPADPTPSERVLSRTVVLGGLVLLTTYTPVSDICSTFGDGYLYALYYETGTAYIKPVGDIGTYTSGGSEYVSKSTSLGKGMPTSIGVAVGEKVVGFVQTQSGEIRRVETELGLGVKSGHVGWKEKSSGSGTVGIETIYKHIVK